jgi:hypothetical protein
MPENKIDYDFIEIGTSSFQALIMNCSDETVGLSIEPKSGAILFSDVYDGSGYYVNLKKGSDVGWNNITY